MNVTFAAMLGGWEIVLILAVVLILFGAKKVPELAKGLGQAVKEFKKAANDVNEEISNASTNPPPPQQQQKVVTGQSQPAQTVPQTPTTPQH